jgi:hypothetical protein
MYSKAFYLLALCFKQKFSHLFFKPNNIVFNTILTENHKKVNRNFKRFCEKNDKKEKGQDRSLVLWKYVLKL